ncbi:MAG TPA: hypothetical protein VFV66_01675 [Nonomuraea sp.]|nr:hypothetical protein [Nonomuraea sp.]
MPDYQVRGWTAWRRHAMLALALLTAIATAQPTSTDDDRIPLTLPEIRRLLATLVLTTAPHGHGHHALAGLASPSSRESPTLPPPAQIRTMVANCHTPD